MHEPRDAGGHGIVLDPGQARGAAERAGQQGEEQPGSHARLQHAAAGEAEALHGAPEGADDGLGRVVGILGGTLEGGILGRRHGVGKVLPDLAPSRAEPGFTRQREGVLRQVGGAEADEAQQCRLLVRRRGAPACFQLLAQPDRGDVVACAAGPSAGKRPVGVQIMIVPRLTVLGHGGGAILLLVVVRGWRRLPLGGCQASAEGGGVEQAEGELGGIGHGAAPRARSRAHRRAWARRVGGRDGLGAVRTGCAAVSLRDACALSCPGLLAQDPFQAPRRGGRGKGAAGAAGPLPAADPCGGRCCRGSDACSLRSGCLCRGSACCFRGAAGSHDVGIRTPDVPAEHRADQHGLDLFRRRRDGQARVQAVSGEGQSRCACSLARLARYAASAVHGSAARWRIRQEAAWQGSPGHRDRSWSGSPSEVGRSRNSGAVRGQVRLDPRRAPGAALGGAIWCNRGAGWSGHRCCRPSRGCGRCRVQHRPAPGTLGSP